MEKFSCMLTFWCQGFKKLGLSGVFTFIVTLEIFDNLMVSKDLKLILWSVFFNTPSPHYECFATSYGFLVTPSHIYPSAHMGSKTSGIQIDLDIGSKQNCQKGLGLKVKCYLAKFQEDKCL